MRNAARKSPLGPSRKSPLGPPFFKGGKEEAGGGSERGWGRSPFRKGGVGGGFLLLLLLALPAQAAPPDFDTLEGWIETYGSVDPAAHAGAKRAEKIFHQLLDVLPGPRVFGEVRLAVVGSGTPVGDPVAYALPDGTVVLSTEMLDLCYDRPSHVLLSAHPKVDRGDAWLAWVLGHELAHLSRNDFAHLAIARGLAGVEMAVERTADHYGMLYMLWAGYDPRELLDSRGSFFRSWQKAYAGRLELGPREVNLKKGLREIYDRLPYFEWGTRLLQLSRYEHGIPLLERFRQTCASREALSNLGLAHYQLAAEHLGRCDSTLVSKFMLPTRIDPRTLDSLSPKRGAGTRSKCYTNTTYRKNLEQAVGWLNAAAEQDREYFPARLNLVAAHLLDAEGGHALTVVDELKDLAPDHPETANARALALFLLGQANDLDSTAEEALKTLDAALQKHPEATYLLFNQARILDELERPEEAKKLWQEFLAAEPSGPWADVARERLGQEATIDLLAPVKRSGTAPLPLGPPTRKGNRMFGLERQPIDKTSSLRGAFHSNHDEGRYALEIDGVVQVVEWRWPSETRSAEDLRERYGEPAHRLPLHRGELLVWPGGYAAEVEEDGSVWAEVWYVP